MVLFFIINLLLGSCTLTGMEDHKQTGDLFEKAINELTNCYANLPVITSCINEIYGCGSSAIVTDEKVLRLADKVLAEPVSYSCNALLQKPSAPLHNAILNLHKEIDTKKENCI